MVGSCWVSLLSEKAIFETAASRDLESSGCNIKSFSYFGHLCWNELTEIIYECLRLSCLGRAEGPFRCISCSTTLYTRAWFPAHSVICELKLSFFAEVMRDFTLCLSARKKSLCIRKPESRHLFPLFHWTFLASITFYTFPPSKSIDISQLHQ